MYSKVNEISPFSLLSLFVLMIFQLFDIWGFFVCHLLDCSVSGARWDLILEHRGSNLVLLAPICLLLRSLLVPFGSLLSPFGCLLAPFGSSRFSFGVHVEPFLPTFVSLAAPCSGNLP